MLFILFPLFVLLHEVLSIRKRFPLLSRDIGQALFHVDKFRLYIDLIFGVGLVELVYFFQMLLLSFAKQVSIYVLVAFVSFSVFLVFLESREKRATVALPLIVVVRG